MLGIRLNREIEQRLDRYARDIGRAKSVVVRDWIVERLERESVDETMRRATASLRDADKDRSEYATAASAAWLEALDAEDGSYDWGPDGPPA